MSDSEKMVSLLARFDRLLTVLEGTNEALTALAQSNEMLADAVFADQHEQGGEEQEGFDMAGNPVRIS